VDADRDRPDQTLLASRQRRRTAMFWIMAVAIALTALGYGASTYQNHGYAWADQVCRSADALCSSPHWFALAAVALLLVYLYRLSNASR
jgi:hypothetical protein